MRHRDASCRKNQYIQARKVLEEISNDEKERYIAELRQKYIMDQKAIEDHGLEKGYQQGLKQGREQTLEELAKEMLKENIDIEMIIKITNLTREKIETLK